MWSGARESSGGGSRDNDDDDDDGDDDHIAETDDDAVDEYVAGLERGGQDSGPSRPDRNRASDREDDIPIIPPASPIPGWRMTMTTMTTTSSRECRPLLFACRWLGRGEGHVLILLLLLLLPWSSPSLHPPVASA